MRRPTPTRRARLRAHFIGPVLRVAIVFGLMATLGGAATASGVLDAAAQESQAPVPREGVDIISEMAVPPDECPDDWCPVSVWVLFDLVNVPRIDERAGVVEIDGRVTVYWFDDRLVASCADDFDSSDEFASPSPGLAIYQGDAAREVLKTMWWPEIVLSDGLGARDTTAFALNIGCTDAFYEERFVAEVSQRFESMNDFPFDRHEIAVTFQAFALPNGMIEFLPIDDPADERNSDRERPELLWKSNEWTVDKRGEYGEVVIINPLYDVKDVDPSLHETFFADVDDDSTYYGDPELIYPSSTFKFEIERDGRFYVTNIVLPLVVIVALSWAVFWSNLGSMSLAERLGVSITSLLTVVAFDFLTGDTLPVLPYTTRLDAFYNSSYLVVAATVVVSILSTRLPERQADDGRVQPNVLDRHCRWIFPLAYGAAVAASMMGWFSPGSTAG